MEWLKCFFENYANAITAFAAFGTFILAAITLIFIKREYSAKFRPFVTPVVQTEPIPEALGCFISIHPHNIGSHPCKAKLTSINLKIGDENYQTPNNQDWILLAPSGVGVIIPVGHVNATGVKNIRENRYRENRIELSFTMETASTESKYSETKKYAYEINVIGESPQALFRPEWVQNA